MRDVQPENASPPIYSKALLVLLNITVFNDVQPENVKFPIPVTPSFIITFFIFLLSSKKLSSISPVPDMVNKPAESRLYVIAII